MRIDSSTSVIGMIGKWMCLAGLAGMAGMYATVTFAPRLLQFVSDATFNRALTLTLGMFGVGFAVWMFAPEPRSSRRRWKLGLFASVVLGALPVIGHKYHLLPAAMDATALVTWLCLCGMAAIVCASRWRTLDDTRDTVRRWMGTTAPSPSASSGAQVTVPGAGPMLMAGIVTPQLVEAMQSGDEAT